MNSRLARLADAAPARFLARISSTQIGLIAAGVAFYTLLAAFPAIAALVALAGLVTEPASVVAQLQTVTELMPDQAALIVLNQAQLVAGAPDNGLSLTLWLGVGFAVYLSTRATTSLIHGLNLVNRRTEDRGVLHFWTVVVLLTAAILFGSVLLLLLMVGVPAALAFLPLDLETSALIHFVRWGVVAAVVVVGLGVVYHWGPAGRTPRWRLLSPGSAIAALLWFAGSYAFAYYVANIAQYNQTFGSLGGVIVLLTWLWLSAYVVLLGALIDAEMRTEPET
jgi:membrane protein